MVEDLFFLAPGRSIATGRAVPRAGGLHERGNDPFRRRLSAGAEPSALAVADADQVRGERRVGAVAAVEDQVEGVASVLRRPGGEERQDVVGLVALRPNVDVTAD